MKLLTKTFSYLKGESLARKGTLFLVIGLLIANLALMVWYIFYGYQLGFHSDGATKVLLAREIVETGQYFPRDWNYVNGDLFVLFGHTFIIPFLAFLPAGFFVHAISGLLSALLILSGGWFISSLFEIGIIKRLAIVAVLAAGISGFMAENLYGQVSYGYVFYLTCYVIYFAWKFLPSIGRRKLLFGVGLFLVLLMAFWANPQRATVSFGLPLLFAVTYYIISNARVSSYTCREAYVGYQLIVLIFLSAVVGALFHSITLHGVNNILGAGNARWLSYDEVIRNATLTLKGFLAIFGGLPSAGGEVVSISGAYEAIRLASALALLLLIPFTLWDVLKQGQKSSRFVATFALVAVLLVLFIQLSTTVPDMGDPVQSSRYLIPSFLLLLIIVLTQPYTLTKISLLALVSTAVTVVLITSAYPTFVRSNDSSGMNWGIVGQHQNNLQKLSDFMLANGLHYGYSSYWNAGVLSVLSNEKALVRQIQIDRGLPIPMRHLSSDRWYRPSSWQGETFLLLNKQEASTIDWDLLGRRYQTKPIRELNFEDFKIFVFAQNIAKNLPGWDRGYEEATNFLAAKESFHQAGKFYENYNNTGSALVAEKGDVGALHYGPYIDVEPGTYIANFDISVDSAPEADAARLDIAADGKMLEETVVKDNNSSRQLIFTLDKPARIEFRVWSLGNARVVFRGVSIERYVTGK